MQSPSQLQQHRAKRLTLPGRVVALVEPRWFSRRIRIRCNPPDGVERTAHQSTLAGPLRCITKWRCWAGAFLYAAAAAVNAASAAPPRPSADAIVDQFQKNEGVFPGHRRNHAKGVCISGYFQGSGKATPYSVARVFAAGKRTPVIGRFSIPGTNPYAWDGSTPIRGMALEFATRTRVQQWRSAMNAVPAFPVATPAADYEFMKLQQPDPATGDPDPQKLAAFFATHPRANAFRVWVQATPPSASYATEQYNSLDSFELVDAQGRRRAVRWSMVPQAQSHGERPDNNSDYLAADLHQRLSHAPLRWHLIITFAKPGDPIKRADIAWPADRRHVDAGTLVIQASQPQTNGPCRDINFDPLVLPPGIAPSDDPLLTFRAAVYAASHRLRVREQERAATTGISANKPASKAR